MEELPTPTTNLTQAMQDVTLTGTTTGTTFSWQNVYAEFVEEEMQRSGDLLISTGVIGSVIPTWLELTTASDMGPIRALLTSLAYGIDDDDPWAILGLSRLEGPKPDLNMLLSRRDVATKLIDAGTTTTLDDATRPRLDRLREKLVNASDECCSNLESILRERRALKGRPRNIPRWMEPSPTIFEYLSTQMAGQGQLAMHLSNLHNIDLTNPAGTVAVKEARALQS